MPYTLRKYDGTVLTTLEDGVVDTASSSIYLIGKDTTNYGTTQNDNFLWLVEHFAGTIEPQNKVQGQIWFDKGSLQPKIYDGYEWRNITLSSTGSSQATNAALGELRFDTTTEQLFAKGASGEVLIGPEKVQGYGTTRLVSDEILDTASNGHACIIMYSDAGVIGVISNDEFDVKSTESIYSAGITHVGKGMTFATGYGLTIDEEYAVKDLDEEITGDWSFTGSSGINVNGTSLSLSAGSFTIDTDGIPIAINATAINPVGSSTTLGTSSSKFSKVYASELNAGSSITEIGLVGQFSLNASSQIFPATDNSILLGKANARWASVFTTGLNAGTSSSEGTITGDWKLGAGSSLDVSAGTFVSGNASVGELATDKLITRFITAGSTSTTGLIEGDWSLTSGSKLRATYADIAEKYATDKMYEPGTVVVFGGMSEVTACTRFEDSTVAGIVTTEPAQILNDGLKDAVAIALVGRVPCKVVGTIKKGDLLVTSDVRGVATSAKNPRPGTLLGKAMADYNSNNIGTIEVMVLRG